RGAAPIGGGLETPAATSTPTLPPAIYRNSLLGSQSDWPDDTNCGGKADGYHIKGAPDSSLLCAPDLADQADVIITVTMKQLSGTQDIYAGIALHRPSRGNSYLYGISADGRWVFAKFSSGTPSVLAGDAVTTAAHKGLSATNTLQVVAKGSHFTFFANGIQVGKADDSSYASGKIGLTVGGDIESVFTNVVVTKA